MTFPKNLQEYLESFLVDKSCLMKETRRPKRSIFGSSDHDELRRVTSVFENNFRNISNHEKARKIELQSMNHKISTEEAGLIEIRSYLKSMQIIDRIHRLQNDFYLLFIGNLRILDIDLRNSDLVSVLNLFNSKNCQFLNIVNACVYVKF